jgi:predicted SnoaL-like aldol condensation-catalyzing enzyme
LNSQHAVTEKEGEMSDLERNKKVVVEYYELAFNDHKPQEAVERYVGSQYIQHNPQAPDGADAFVEFVTSFVGQFPKLTIDIKRVVAEGDTVVTHGLIQSTGTSSSRFPKRVRTITPCFRQGFGPLRRGAASGARACRAPSAECVLVLARR